RRASRRCTPRRASSVSSSPARSSRSTSRARAGTRSSPSPAPTRARTSTSRSSRPRASSPAPPLPEGRGVLRRASKGRGPTTSEWSAPFVMAGDSWSGRGSPAWVPPDEGEEPLLDARVLRDRLLLAELPGGADQLLLGGHTLQRSRDVVLVEAVVLAGGAGEVPGVEDDVGREVLVEHRRQRQLSDEI